MGIGFESRIGVNFRVYSNFGFDSRKGVRDGDALVGSITFAVLDYMHISYICESNVLVMTCGCFLLLLGK